MRKITLLIALMALAHGTVSAQGRRGTESTDLTYTILKDDVENYKIARVGFSFLNTDISFANVSAYGVGFFANGEIGKKLYLEGNYSFSLVERLLHPFEPDLQTDGFVSVNDDSRSNRLRLEGTYYFSSKTTREDIEVSLKQSTRGRTTVNYYTLVEGNQLTRIGARIGLDRGFTSYNMSSADELSALLENGSTYDINYDGEVIGSSFLTYSVMRLGVARSKLTNLHINTPQYGYRRSSSIAYLYGDVLIAMNQEIDDVFVKRNDVVVQSPFEGGPSTPYYSRMNLQDAVEFRNVGLAIGYRVNNLSTGFEQLVEAGIYPGVQGVNGLYINIGWRYGLGTSQKIKENKK